jgi:hypothetical protein
VNYLESPKFSPLLDGGDIAGIVANYESDLQEGFNSILEHLRVDQKIELPCFRSQVGSATARTHIDNLKIPTLPSSPEIPSLLLHNLRRASDERVKDLFTADSRKK